MSSFRGNCRTDKDPRVEAGRPAPGIVGGGWALLTSATGQVFLALMLRNDELAARTRPSKNSDSILIHQGR
jgi:hypothetical protein